MAMKEVRFEYMEAYVMKRNNKISKYMVTQLILYLCKEIEWMPGRWVAKR